MVAATSTKRRQHSAPSRSALRSQGQAELTIRVDSALASRVQAFPGIDWQYWVEFAVAMESLETAAESIGRERRKEFQR